MRRRFISARTWGLLFSIIAGFASAARVTAQAPEIRPIPPSIPERRFNITEFGAKGDGVTDNTLAFRKAIAACQIANGGKIVVPVGTFVTGPIEFVSHMSIVLEKGAVIRGSGNPSDFLNHEVDEKPSAFAHTPILPLIRGDRVTDIAIEGEGTIDGNGLPFWQKFRAERAAGAPQEGQTPKPGQPTATPRPKLVWLVGCERIVIRGVTLTNSPQFHLVPNRCHEVLIENVTVIAPENAPNTDGIDPTGSRNIVIRHCLVDVGDDDVAFKSNPGDEPLENVLVTDCKFLHGHGVSIGSNIGGGIKNVTVERSTFEGTDNGIRIKSVRGRGAVVENIAYRDIQMKNVGVAITINLFYFDKGGQQARENKPVDRFTPTVRNVSIENVTVNGAKTAGEIIGLPEMPIRSIRLENVHIVSNTGMQVQDAQQIRFRNVEIKPSKGEPITSRFADIQTN